MVVIHVERAFSAQPTLSSALGPDAAVYEMPLPEALATDLTPDLIWTSNATAESVRLLRTRFPLARLLATVHRAAPPPEVVHLFACGADQVLRDEGVLLAAAALQALARPRGLPRQPRPATAEEPSPGGPDDPDDPVEPVVPVEPSEPVAAVSVDQPLTTG